MIGRSRCSGKGVVRGDTQVLTVGGQGKPPMIDHGGRYEDVYVKTAEGWRIKTRKYVRTFPPE